jgi:membrane-associated phospholipid phosphatase
LGISYPYAVKETVTTSTLVLVSVVAPAALIVILTFFLVPTPTALRGAPWALVWRRKIWEWNAGWMGLGVALAGAFMATEGLKDLMGKPRPDFLARCDPDLSKIATYAVSGLGRQLAGAPTLVTWEICRNQSSNVKIDGFASFPSGHSSCKYICISYTLCLGLCDADRSQIVSFAGMTYLTLWLCAKFSISFPYLGPRLYSPISGHAETHHETPSLEYSKAAPGHSSSLPASSSSSSSTASLRNQGAAPPVYLLIIAFVPLCVAAFVASSRWFNHRHHGFDILFGSVMGILFAWVGFRLYHLPIRRSNGWAWAARSRGHAFFRGTGYADLVSPEGWASNSSTLRTDGNGTLRRDVDVEA